MKRIKELEQLIRHHKTLYYGSGNIEISDAEYDKLEDELRRLDPQNSVLSIVGSKVKSNNKVAHGKKMLSLQKTYNIDDLEQWRANRLVVSTHKIDGVSCSLIYKQGKFIQAKTRGDGAFGEDITESVRWMRTVPTEISDQAEVEIRGEMYCNDEQFYHLSKEMEKLGLQRPTSPRNIVAGLISRKDHVQLAQFINFMAFDLIEQDSEIKSEHGKFERMAELGFDTPKYELHQKKETISETIDETREFMANGDYQIDGVVFALDQLDLQKELGETSHHPRYKMAFKFEGDLQETVIKEISWGVSRNGILTPVANVEPVELSGAMVSRVTLHNLGMVELHQLKKGDRIKIIRSGEVIPKFIEVVDQVEGTVDIPEKCPECQQTVEQREIRLICNNMYCPGRIRESIVYFVQKMGIDDLSYKRLNSLIDAGLVKELKDIFKLRAEQLLEIEKIKDKLANKIISNIEKSRRTTLAKLITSLGIAGGAINKTEKIIRAGYNTVDDFLSLSVEKLMKVPSFAEKSATEYIKSLEDKKQVIRDLISNGVEIQKAEIKSTAVTGKSICITGSLSEKRSVIAERIREAGGEMVSAVSSKTDLLVTNDIEGNSTKLKKAKSLGIKIINEEMLKDILE